MRQSLRIEDDLAERYRLVCQLDTDIRDHLPRFVEMVHERNAQHVIELGTRTGYSTIAWLHALEKTGGRLTSVDLEPKPEIGDWAHWTYRQGDDLDPAVVSALAPADIIFVDTSHLYSQTIAELTIYRWLAKPGGLLVLHDTLLERPIGSPRIPRFPVRTAIEEFCAAESLSWTHTEACWGLGVITLP